MDSQSWPLCRRWKWRFIFIFRSARGPRSTTSNPFRNVMTHIPIYNLTCCSSGTATGIWRRSLRWFVWGSNPSFTRGRCNAHHSRWQQFLVEGGGSLSSFPWCGKRSARVATERKPITPRHSCHSSEQLRSTQPHGWLGFFCFTMDVITC